jgi:hypothetical protein
MWRWRCAPRCSARSPSKPPAPKKQKKGGDGASSSQALVVTDSQAEISSDHEDAHVVGADYAADDQEYEEQIKRQLDNSIYE